METSKLKELMASEVSIKAIEKLKREENKRKTEENRKLFGAVVQKALCNVKEKYLGEYEAKF